MIERKIEEEGEAPERPNQPSYQTGTLVVLTTDLGKIRIVLRPDLSSESVEYIHRLVEESGKCQRCNLYRAEKPGILQGVMAHPDVIVNKERGPCPASVRDVHNDCPAWDTNCGCHGPIMTRGTVGWAGGGTGPDFFVDVYERPATWWGTMHTVFGMIEDDESFAVIDQMWEQPTRDRGGMKLLENPIHFDMELVPTAVAENT
jgi:cyclophilin family peptidyl-prolyl cis-trans isomerase